jgi:hypothetical protein
MIEITFKDFYEYKYHEDGFYELYVMKNGLGEILYVGISNQNIWNRWFGWNGHIMGDAGYMVGESSVGRKIVNHLPDSWNWKIQLWTLDDCETFCADEFNLHGRYTIRFLEPFMIQKLHPILNVNYNKNPGIDHMPLSEKEKRRKAVLDRVYYEVFEKKTKSSK